MKLETVLHISDEDSISRQSLVALYEKSFLFIILPLSVVAVLQLIFFPDALISFLLFDVLLAIIFFKIFGRNSLVRSHQICFHQIFVFVAAVGAIIWFLLFPDFRYGSIMLTITTISAYLLIDRRTTIAYLFLLYAFYLFIYYQFPIIKAEYLLVAFAFSVGSILVSTWLNNLIQTGNRLEKAKTKYQALFEGGSFPVLLLSRQEGEFRIIETNEQCASLFHSSKTVLNSKLFQSFLVHEMDREKVNEALSQLQHLDRFNLECEMTYTDSAETFWAELSFVGLEMEKTFVIQLHIKDITEKKQGAQRIHQNMESFQNILDNSPAAIFIFTDENLVYTNSIGKDLHHRFLQSSERNLFHIFPDNQRFLLQELINEAKDKVSSYTEITLGEKDQKRFSIHLVKIDYEGKSSYLIMLMDISLQNEYNVQRLRAEIAEEANRELSDEIAKHKTTQKELIENTSKLNALFESSSSLFILTIDRDLNIASFNSSFKRMMKKYLGVDVAIGDDFLNTFPIEEAAYGKLIKRFKSALRGESVEIISHFPTLHGQIWVESFISPVRVEGELIKEIAFIAHNITDKVQNERKVLDSEANNRATVSAIPDMLFKVNKEGYFTDYRLNDEGEKLLKDFAYTTDLLNRHLDEVFKNPDLSVTFMLHIKKALKTGRVHTQNFTIPFMIGKTDKKLYYENRYSRVNSNEVIIITRDVTDKVEFETRLIESVKEKEVLLKEVHHRVKNNLQVISSILNLQSSYVEDEKTLEIINESQNRIRSMSYIHESLYQTKDFSSIDFHDYITNLIQNLVHSYQIYTSETKLNLNIERVQLVLDQAIPCGLILNELVSNSMKYAYPNNNEGEIQVEIQEEDGKVTIRVEDFGGGLPEGFKIEDSDSLGLGLVDTLVDQIDGELILDTEKGTKYLIIFDKQEL